VPIPQDAESRDFYEYFCQLRMAFFSIGQALSGDVTLKAAQL
jgi:hypothetical protein